MGILQFQGCIPDWCEGCCLLKKLKGFSRCASVSRWSASQSVLYHQLTLGTFTRLQDDTEGWLTPFCSSLPPSRCWYTFMVSWLVKIGQDQTKDLVHASLVLYCKYPTAVPQETVLNPLCMYAEEILCHKRTLTDDDYCRNYWEHTPIPFL